MKFSLTKTRILSVLLLLAVIIRLYYYFLVIADKQIPDALPITRGQDFFQIPNGAYSFLSGSRLTGHDHYYINCCGVNDNVYHPFFTLAIGLPLIMLAPWTSFYIWIFLHFLADIFIILYLIKRFSSSNLLKWVLIFYLINFYSYYEIINNQYHFLLNLSIFLFLLEFYFKKKGIIRIFYYLVGLLIKPIGSFWAIPMIFNKHFKIAFFSFCIFLLLCLPFYFNNVGKYYFDNLSYNIMNSNYANWNVFYIFSYFNINNIPIREIKLITVIIITMFCLIFRVNVIRSIVLWILYVLFMYQNNFPYHFSVVSVIIPLVLLFKQIKINFATVISMFILAIPVPLMTLFSEKLLIFNPDIDTNKKLLFLIWVYLGLMLFCYNFIFSIIKNRKNNYV